MKSLQYLDRQISFSYSENNVINLSGPFSSEVDPTRLVFNNASDKGPSINYDYVGRRMEGV